MVYFQQRLLINLVCPGGCFAFHIILLSNKFPLPETKGSSETVQPREADPFSSWLLIIFPPKVKKRQSLSSHM